MFTVTMTIEFDAESAAQAVEMFIECVAIARPAYFQVKDPDGVQSTVEIADRSR